MSTATTTADQAEAGRLRRIAAEITDPGLAAEYRKAADKIDKPPLSLREQAQSFRDGAALADRWSAGDGPRLRRDLLAKAAELDAEADRAEQDPPTIEALLAKAVELHRSADQLESVDRGVARQFRGDALALERAATAHPFPTGKSATDDDTSHWSAADHDKEADRIGGLLDTIKDSSIKRIYQQRHDHHRARAQQLRDDAAVQDHEAKAKVVASGKLVNADVIKALVEAELKPKMDDLRSGLDDVQTRLDRAAKSAGMPPRTPAGRR